MVANTGWSTAAAVWVQAMPVCTPVHTDTLPCQGAGTGRGQMIDALTVQAQPLTLHASQVWVLHPRSVVGMNSPRPPNLSVKSSPETLAQACQQGLCE